MVLVSTILFLCISTQVDDLGLGRRVLKSCGRPDEPIRRYGVANIVHVCVQFAVPLPDCSHYTHDDAWYSHGLKMERTLFHPLNGGWHVGGNCCRPSITVCNAQSIITRSHHQQRQQHLSITYLRRTSLCLGFVSIWHNPNRVQMAAHHGG